VMRAAKGLGARGMTMPAAATATRIAARKRTEVERRSSLRMEARGGSRAASRKEGSAKVGFPGPGPDRFRWGLSSGSGS